MWNDFSLKDLMLVSWMKTKKHVQECLRDRFPQAQWERASTAWCKICKLCNSTSFNLCGYRTLSTGANPVVWLVRVPGWYQACKHRHCELQKAPCARTATASPSCALWMHSFTKRLWRLELASFDCSTTLAANDGVTFRGTQTLKMTNVSRKLSSDFLAKQSSLLDRGIGSVLATQKPMCPAKPSERERAEKCKKTKMPSEHRGAPNSMSPPQTRLSVSGLCRIQHLQALFPVLSPRFKDLTNPWPRPLPILQRNWAHACHFGH